MNQHATSNEVTLREVRQVWTNKTRCIWIITETTWVLIARNVFLIVTRNTMSNNTMTLCTYIIENCCALRFQASLSGCASCLLLRRNPCIEIVLRVYDRVEGHMRVLRSTELGTLAIVDACLISLEPLRVVVAWNIVGLTSKRGYPEAVNDVV